MNKPLFSPEEWLRYTRHIQLPQVGASGQNTLKHSHILVVGTGGLGSPVLYYLAAAGVGTLTIIDHDTVDITNLQRQILFTNNQLGVKKVAAAKTRLTELNPEVRVNSIAAPFSTNNAKKYVNNADLVLDCTDNFTTRYLINDICTELSTPWIYGSVHQFSGQCALFTPGASCFRCIFPEFPDNTEDCNTAGVLGVLPGIIGLIQANEAIKYLCNLPTPLKDHLLLYDALQLTQQKIKLTKNPECLNCGQRRDTSSLTNFYDRSSCAMQKPSVHSIDFETFETLRAEENTVLIDVRSEEEHACFNIGGKLLPLDKLPNSIESLNKNNLFLCYCQTGIRSQKACELISRANLRCHSLKGGLVNWLRASGE